MSVAPPRRRGAALAGLAERVPTELAAVAPGLVLLLVGLVLATLDGGFPPSTWYPAALFVLAVVAIVVLAGRPALPRDRLFLASAGALALFCGWCFLSITWADVPAAAWDGANRSLLYLLVFIGAGLAAWPRRAAATALGLVAFGVAAIAAVMLLIGALAGQPADLFLEGRLSDPTGYANATANLWLIGFWPALHLAAGRVASWPIRGLALAAAALLLETALLSQSRGAAVGFAATAVVYVALVPHRFSALGGLAVLVGLAGLTWAPLTDVREAATTGALDAALADATILILLSALAAFATAAFAAVAAEPWQAALERPALRRSGRLAIAALAAVLAVGALAATASGWVGDRYEDFKSSGYEEVEAGRTRFTGSLGSNRYDFYRVALNEFRAHPIQGIGADNFAVPYTRTRRSSEAPRYAHSLGFNLISQVGLVGTALFAAAVLLAFAAVLRRLRRGPALEAGLAAGAFAGFAMFLTHAMADWLWEVPALGVLGFGLLAVGARVAGPGEEEPSARGARTRREGPRLRPATLARGLGAAAALAAAVSLALPGVSARLLKSAYADFGGDLPKALGRLDRAADLNPLSAEPLVAKAVISRRASQLETARAALREALEREPSNWFARFELALVDAESGQNRSALRNLRSAEVLNPRQPVIKQVADRVAAGERVDATAAERDVYLQLGSKLRAVGSDRK